MKLTWDAVYTPTLVCARCIHGEVENGDPVCRFDGGKPIKFFDPSYACPKGKWKQARVYIRGVSETQIEFDEDTKLLWIARPDKNLEALLDSDYDRVPETLHWTIRPTSFLGDAIGFARSIASGRTAPPHIVERRKAGCFGTPTQAPCPALKTTDKGSFCGECRCPQSATARLDGDKSKLTWGFLICPRAKPGFSNARPEAKNAP